MDWMGEKDISRQGEILLSELVRLSVVVSGEPVVATLASRNAIKQKKRTTEVVLFSRTPYRNF